MLVFKVDIMEKLRAKGYTGYTLQRSGILGSQTVHDIKHGIVPGTKAINVLCAILECQPGTLLKWIPDGSTKEDKE